MLRHQKLAPSSHSLIDHDITQWLKHRQEVLIHYSQLCSTSPAELETLEAFCQLLMDYLSFAHFKMFEKLAECYQSQQSTIVGLDKTLLDKIAKTTDIALDFNDKYTEPKSLETLSSDLSYLGENLANRMDWEDLLIKNYSQFYSQI